jgi:hypothetical protein
VIDFKSAAKDNDTFKSFHGMLQAVVYIAPSAYELGLSVFDTKISILQ